MPSGTFGVCGSPVCPEGSTFSIFLFILFYESLFRDFSAPFVAVTRSYLEMGNSQILALTFQCASEVPKNQKILTDGPDNGPQRLPEATDT